MNIDWAYFGLITFGVVLGVAALPWRHEMNNPDNPWIFVAAVACFWPLLLPYLILFAFQAYRKKWWAYLDQCERVRRIEEQKGKDF